VTVALEKAVIVNTVTGGRVPVQFNPEEYTLNKDINYAATGVPGLSGPILQFVNGNLRTLEMELLLDTYEGHLGVNAAGEDVRALTRRVTDLMAIDPGTHAPPVLLFVWGSLTFTCVLARASERYVMFRPDGAPVRARVSVTFNEFRNADLEAKQLKRETADFSKVHVAGQDETLAQVAWLAYGDASLWRAIALRNGIDDPRELALGTRLVVPRLPYRDPESGEVHGTGEEVRP
jgi:hypothetical protein